ncbi:MAG: thioredoxin [Clostridia bacterium]|nr:thioredoxin [Clostridia bacterium]
MAEIKLTKDNFEAEVIGSEIPVLVDFWAEWCGPCKMLAPVVEEIAKDFEGKVKVGKVNIDEEMQLAMKYGIVSIPTMLLFENGKVVKKSVGFAPKDALIEELGI